MPLAESSSPSSPEWVAVIDDHDSIRVALTRALRFFGIAAEAFCSAEDYLQVGHPRSPSCLVLDVQLPGMSGFQLESELTKRESPPPPIIFISAHGDLLSNFAPSSSSRSYLAKPFQVEQLVELIDQALH